MTLERIHTSIYCTLKLMINLLLLYIDVYADYLDSDELVLKVMNVVFLDMKSYELHKKCNFPYGRQL